MFFLSGCPSPERGDGASYPAPAPVERVGTSKCVLRSGRWSALYVLALGLSFPGMWRQRVLPCASTSGTGGDEQ
eukprot:5251358-Prorocentrum_lima.AAC.1